MAVNAPEVVNNKIVLGSGYLYFDEEDASGNLQGEVYMGDTPGFSLNVSTEKVEIDGSDTPVAEKVLTITKSVTRAGSVACRNFNDANQALFVMGVVETVTQTATPVTDEAHTVDQGKYYQLGRSTSNPTGVRNVSSVAVTGTGGTPSYTETTDYVVHAEEGRIYIVEGGGISDGTAIEVDYTPAANSRTRVKATGDKAKTGALHFVADNTSGENYDVYIPKCEISASGDAALKSRDNVIELGFDVNIQTRTGYAQVYLDGEPA